MHTIKIVERNNQNIVIANGIADGIKKLQPIDCNFVAMATAQLLADGKDKCELNEVVHFLQLVILALKTYTNGL